jgi:transcriptional regulator with XRE-family HTH domain
VRGLDRRHRELADFLSSRRKRVSPADVGLPPTGRRRTPGLRREELAMLAGMSATWYTYLEQGRDIRVSEAVLESLARTLRLDPGERTHLFLLAHGAPPPDQDVPAETLDPTVARLLDLLGSSPAYVTGAYWDLLGWNRAAAELFAGFGSPEGRHNLAWWVFTDPAAREVLADWEAEAQGLLARFRAACARHPDDPRFAAMVADLSAASPQVRRWWPRHDVRSSAGGTKTLRHRRLGDLTLDHTVLQVAEAPEQKLVVYTAAPGTPAATALAELAAVTARRG